MDEYLLRYLYPFYAKPGDDAAGSGSDEGAEGDQGAGEGAEGDQGTPEGAGEGAEGDGEQEAEAAPKPDWRDKQLRKRNAQLAEARAALSKKDEIEAENARLKALLEAAQKASGGKDGSEDGARSPAPTTKGLTEAEVEARAERIAAEKQFKRDTEAALAQGAKDYPKKDWEQAIENVKAAGGFDPEVLAQILGTDNPAKIIFELGKDPDRFEEVNNLSPHRRMAEFVKMTIDKPAPRKAISNAAEPVTPVGGRGVQAVKVNVYDPNISDDDYYAARQAQAAGDKRARARYHRGLSGD